MLLELLGWVGAALCLGLYLGERGRRLSAERYLVTGSPDTRAPKAVSRLPSQEMEDRFRAETDEAYQAAVERGVNALMEEARAKGMVVDAKQIRRDVETMLAGEDVLG